MNLQEVRRIIEDHDARIRDQFNVATLWVFGSVARGEAGEGSDIDMLVEFDGPYNYAQLLDLAEFLEGILATRVDLITLAALTARARSNIDRERQRVA